MRLTLLRAALDAAGRGWYVFPLRPDNRPDDPDQAKRPAFPNRCTAERCDRTDPRCRAAGRHVGWEERATTDPDRIRRAWSTSPYNIGIACGPSGLVVVDADLPKPGRVRPAEWDMPGVDDGTDVLAVLAERAGQPYPADTYTVTTWSGGTQLYYRHPTGPELRNTAGRLGWLIDTRGPGGYVVAAGSTVNGSTYTVVQDAAPLPLPDWLADPLRPAPLPARRPGPVALGTGRQAAYLHAAIERETSLLTQAGEGTRNYALYTAATALGQLAAGGALAEADVFAALEPVARSLPGRHRLTGREISRTIASGLRAGARRPRSVAV